MHLLFAVALAAPLSARRLPDQWRYESRARHVKTVHHGRLWLHSSTTAAPRHGHVLAECCLVVTVSLVRSTVSSSVKVHVAVKCLCRCVSASRLFRPLRLTCKRVPYCTKLRICLGMHLHSRNRCESKLWDRFVAFSPVWCTRSIYRLKNLHALLQTNTHAHAQVRGLILAASKLVVTTALFVLLVYLSESRELATGMCGTLLATAAVCSALVASGTDGQAGEEDEEAAALAQSR